MAKVNAHDLLPSWNNQTYPVQVGNSLTITDTNNILSTMFLSGNTTGTPVEVSGNTLKVTPSANSIDGSISFQKVPNTSLGTSIVYRKPSYQSLVEFHLEQPALGKLNVDVIHLGNLQVENWLQMSKA